MLKKLLLPAGFKLLLLLQKSKLLTKFLPGIRKLRSTNAELEISYHITANRRKPLLDEINLRQLQCARDLKQIIGIIHEDKEEKVKVRKSNGVMILHDRNLIKLCFVGDVRPSLFFKTTSRQTG